MGVKTYPNAPGFEFKLFIEIDENGMIHSAGESGINTEVDSWSNHVIPVEKIEVTDNPNLPPSTRHREWHSIVQGMIYNPVDQTFSPAPVPARRVIPASELLDRFEVEEEIAFEQAAQTLPEPSRSTLAVFIRRLERKSAQGQTINLDDPAVVDGMNFLRGVAIASGIWATPEIADTRVAEILS